LELLEEELVIRNDSVHLISLFDLDEYDNIAVIKVHDTEDYNQKIIGGLVGTFHSFKNLRKFDTINSIQLNYLRLLFTISHDYVTVYAVDPEQTGEYYFKVVRTFLDCVELATGYLTNGEKENNYKNLQTAIEMVFLLILESKPAQIRFSANDTSEIHDIALIKINEILNDIYQSHGKFFKRVIN
jgi:hypothetical protein